jgi:hypothetical protein
VIQFFLVKNLESTIIYLTIYLEADAANVQQARGADITCGFLQFTKTRVSDMQ